MQPVWQRFAGSDRRSLTGVEETVQEVLREPERMASLVEGMRHADPAVNGPCADAAEKISAMLPEPLASHKKALLRLAMAQTSASVRWHLAQILPRLPLNRAERAGLSEILFEYLNHESALVKTFAMQSLADLAAGDERLTRTVLPAIEHLTENGTAAMRARGRKLLTRLRGQSSSRRSETQ